MSKELIRIIDSHTGGEPTRVVTDGFPDLGTGTVRERLAVFRTRYDHLRRAMISEPRGFPAIVGALLCNADNENSDAGVIFFNNEGYLGMCGHGTIGVVKTLEFLGKLESKSINLDTVAGTVEAVLHRSGSVSVRNVESYRFRADVEVVLKDAGTLSGDIAWGGNWFFLVKDHDLEISMSNLEELRLQSRTIMESLLNQGITGANGETIDHIELFGDSEKGDSKNFVLCPGGEYDRSPCGTGTSAKLACLAADGLLAEGQVWTQEGVTGSVFEGTYVLSGKGVIPTITGEAFVISESTLILDDDDPFRHGIPE